MSGPKINKGSGLISAFATCLSRNLGNKMFTCLAGTANFELFCASVLPQSKQETGHAWPYTCPREQRLQSAHTVPLSIPAICAVEFWFPSSAGCITKFMLCMGFARPPNIGSISLTAKHLFHIFPSNLLVERFRPHGSRFPIPWRTYSVISSYAQMASQKKIASGMNHKNHHCSPGCGCHNRCHGHKILFPFSNRPGGAVVATSCTISMIVSPSGATFAARCKNLKSMTKSSCSLHRTAPHIAEMNNGEL